MPLGFTTGKYLKVELTSKALNATALAPAQCKLYTKWQNNSTCRHSLLHCGLGKSWCFFKPQPDAGDLFDSVWPRVNPLLVFLYQGQENSPLALTCLYARKEPTNNWAVLSYTNGLILIFCVYILAESLLMGVGHTYAQLQPLGFICTCCYWTILPIDDVITFSSWTYLSDT